MNLRSESTNRLFEAILGLETVDDCYAFFEDLCTIKELQDMSFGMYPSDSLVRILAPNNQTPYLSLSSPLKEERANNLLPSVQKPQEELASLNIGEQLIFL